MDCATASAAPTAMLLLKDPAGERLVTVGSRGYLWSGIGSEVTIGEAMIGTAAAERRTIRISDMSRIRRFGDADTRVGG